MKKDSYYSKSERLTIKLGYLWRWGSIGIMLLVPAITFGICGLLDIESETQRFITFMSAGVTFFCVGIYDIIGTILGFKHILVSLQLATHIPFQSINPRRGWLKSEKKEQICVGIFFVIIGVAIIIIFTLMQFGILRST